MFGLEYSSNVTSSILL